MADFSTEIIAARKKRNDICSVERIEDVNLESVPEKNFFKKKVKIKML